LIVKSLALLCALFAMLRALPVGLSRRSGRRIISQDFVANQVRCRAVRWDASSLRIRCSLLLVQRPRTSATVAAVETQAPAVKVSDQKGPEGQESKKKDEDAPMGWGRFFLYGFSGISSLVFIYYFHQAKYSLHQTEILLLDRFRRLPFYWPLGPSEAEHNGDIRGEGLQPDLVIAFSEWFITTDLQEAGGVVREDVLELFEEFGLGEDHPAAKEFLRRGEGQLEEHRRYSGAGLQECIQLLAKMCQPNPKEGSPPPPNIGAEAVQILRRKTQRATSVMTGVSALQQAMQNSAMSSAQLPPAASSAQQGTADSSLPSGAQPAGGRVGVAAGGGVQITIADEDDADDDDANDEQHKRMEATRLQRIEDDLMKRLERNGSLSPGEEARLQDAREKRRML